MLHCSVCDNYFRIKCAQKCELCGFMNEVFMSVYVRKKNSFLFEKLLNKNEKKNPHCERFKGFFFLLLLYLQFTLCLKDLNEKYKQNNNHQHFLPFILSSFPPIYHLFIPPDNSYECERKKIERWYVRLYTVLLCLSHSTRLSTKKKEI